MSMMVKSVAVEKQSQLECPKLHCFTYTLLLVKKQQQQQQQQQPDKQNKTQDSIVIQLSKPEV